MTNINDQAPYDRFLIIMNEAAGDSDVDYQGYKRFWNTLTLDELQEVSIYGVRMIAPKEDHGQTGTPSAGGGDHCGPKSSCCGGDKEAKAEEHHEEAAAGPVWYPGRGAASGLVRGLRGEIPFDGTQFPRLPFGGNAVSDSDIQFISDWIDAGCPRDKMPEHVPSAYDNPMTRGEQGHPPLPTAHTQRFNDGYLTQRKNAQYMQGRELEDLRAAMAKVKSYDGFDLDRRSFKSYAQIHGDSCQHGWEQFLPWHRAYLLEFEHNLQDVIPGVSLPYWDWTMPKYKGGVIGPNGVSGVIPDMYHALFSKEVLENLKSQFPSAGLNKLDKMVGKSYNSGTECLWTAQDKAKEWTDEMTEALFAQLALSNPFFHRQRYPGMFYKKDKKTKQYIMKDGKPVLMQEDEHWTGYTHQYPSAEEIQDILEIDNWADFGGGHVANHSFGVLSQNPHNTGHIWSGGENPLADPTAPNGPGNITMGDMFNDLVAFFDPIAYGHHSNVDRLWAKWQQLHPGNPPEDLTDIMIPWQYSIQQLLNISKLGYEYVKGSQHFNALKNTPYTKMRSHDTGAHPDLLKNHSKAVIRLHKVQRSVNSHYIRVFLNSPDADHTTPTVGNDNYVGYIARFGHGNCVGGEGHCDIPSETRRKFDNRPRHHNTPTNHTLDATKAIKKLMDKGAKDVHVNVVCLGQDGHLATGDSRLRMDGVSINFFD